MSRQFSETKPIRKQKMKRIPFHISNLGRFNWGSGRGGLGKSRTSYKSSKSFEEPVPFPSHLQGRQPPPANLDYFLVSSLRSSVQHSSRQQWPSSITASTA